MGIGFESNKLVDGPAHASLYQTSGKRIDTVHSKFKVAMNVGKWLIPPPQTIAGKHAHHYWIIHSCWSEWWRSERKVKHAHHVKLRFASSFRQLQLISLQSSSHGIRLNVWMNELTWNWRCKPPTKAGSLQFCFFCFFWWRNAPISWHFRNLVTYGSKSPHVTGTSHAFFSIADCSNASHRAVSDAMTVPGLGSHHVGWIGTGPRSAKQLATSSRHSN